METAGRNIFLCGFMGCGKTTVGKALASLIDRPFIDMDEYIERQAGQTVSEIFAAQGEGAFRELERRAAGELSAGEDLIVATGGGTVLDSRNRDHFHTGGRIVFIDPPLSLIRRRLRGDATRPLLNAADRDTVLRELYDRRIPLYRAAADVTVTVENGMTPEDVARRILRLIRQAEPD